MPFISMITCFFPFFSLPVIIILLFVTRNIKLKKIYAILFSISIGFILYKMIPRNTMDLFRYYEMMDIYSNINFIEFLKQYLLNIEPLINIVFYFFSKFNDHHLIIVLTTFISYSIMFYIIFDYQKEVKLSNLKFNIVLFYFLTVFLVIYNITGIRFCIARLLFFLALYLDFFKNKKGITLLFLYIIPVTIHQSAILLLLIRFLLMLNKNNFDFKFILFSVAVLLFPAYIVKFISTIFGNSSYLMGIIDKAIKYVSYGNTFANIYKLQLALTFLILIILIVIKSLKIKTNEKFLNYTFLICFVSLGFINSETISTRFIGVLCSLAVILFMDLLNSLNSKNTIAFLLLIIPFCLFYLTFQFVQFYADGIFDNLIFDYKYTFIAISFLCLNFLILDFKKMRIKED